MQIELLKPHTHAGKHLTVGERLDLPETSARWLIAQGTAQTTVPTADSKPNRRDAASSTTTGTPQGD